MLVKESAPPVPRALSRRTQPSRQEQRAALPRPSSACARSATWHPLSRTPWRLTPVLQPRRMNILTPASRAQPDAGWMEQVARNATMQDSGYLNGCRYLLHDRDQKFCREFRETLAAGGVKCLPLPASSPNLNAYAERWVRSIKEECLSKLILFGEKS